MKTTPLTYARAKHMRREPTDAEKRLWGGLCGSRLSGLKFHRQVPIGPYIVDFLNREHRLVVEVDGDSQGQDAAIAFDARQVRDLIRLVLRTIHLLHFVEKELRNMRSSFILVPSLPKADEVPFLLTSTLFLP
jgi:very-short-patch-repair endonuclease